MNIEQLKINQHRNLKQVSIQPNARFNVILGDNGQGKTNLLSAIYFLATLKGLRAKSFKELVTWGEHHSFIEALVERRSLSHLLRVEINQGKRTCFRENKTCQVNQYFGVLSVVCFTPDDLDLVKGSPEERRHFLDRAIFNVMPQHLDIVLHYQKALEAKNKLLKDPTEDKNLLDAYDQTLARIGGILMMNRVIHAQRLAISFEQIFAEMMKLEGKITYKPSIVLEQELTLERLQNQLYQTFIQHRISDKQRGFTQKGPHVDDLLLTIQQQSAKAYASQGQQRAMVLALKIAEIEAISKIQGNRPILLLDDISSELDPTRNQHLFDYLEKFDGQVFITATQQNFKLNPSLCTIFKVHQGQITAIPSN